MSPKPRWILIFLSAPLVVVAALGGIIGTPRAKDAPQKGFEQLRVFEDVVSLVTQAYVEDVNPDKVMDGAMRGLAESLDPSSAFLPPDEVALVEKNVPLAEGDPGLMITRQFYLRVLGVRDHSPAANAGLRSGDYLRMIGDTPTRDMSVFTGMRLLRGPVGSTVKVVVIRGNAAEPHELTLAREQVTLNIRGDLAGTVGVIRAGSFATGAAGALRATAERLSKSGARALVVDIRGVADGSYDEAIKAAQVFVSSGPVAWRAGRDAAQKEVIQSAGERAVTTPVVLLQSFGTAGPAEVFAAALSGAKRAEIVGERTAGLAAEQHLVKLPQGYGLWMTYRRYFTAGGESILEKGVQADVVADTPTVDFGERGPAAGSSDDAMLAKAIERAKAGKTVQ